MGNNTPRRQAAVTDTVAVSVAAADIDTQNATASDTDTLRLGKTEKQLPKGVNGCRKCNRRTN